MDSKKVKICNSQNYSEFNEEMLKSSGFFKAIKRILYDTANIFNKKERIEYAIKELNKFFAEESKKNPSESKSFNWNSPKTDELLQEDVQDMISYELYRKIGYNSNIYEIVKIDFSEKLRKLRESLLSLGHDNCYDRKAVEDYLNNFCNFIVETFKKKNYYYDFASSQLIKNLNYLGEIPFENSTLAKKGYSYVNMYNPYVLDAIMRIIYNISGEHNRLNSISEIRELRYAMFINQAEYAFDGNSLRYDKLAELMFDKNSGQIISKPFNSLSSVERINPVILFEKIARYITEELDKIKKNNSNVEIFDINVLIIGDTGTVIEKDGIKVNPELCDLINSVVYWYNRSFTTDEPKLNLILNAIVNEDNVLRECADVECVVNKNKGIAQIYSLNYLTSFVHKFSKLQELINANDMVFILNCPWIYYPKPNYHASGGIENFDYIFKEEEDDLLRFAEIDSLDNKYFSKVQRIKTYYVSLFNSDFSLCAPRIKRHIRNDILYFLKEYLNTLKTLKLKEVYIYYSDENKTLKQYSVLESYVFTKTELCNGKYFTVAKFINRKSKPLSCVDKPKFNFKISLWELLKCISLEFAFVDFKKIVNKYFGNYIKNSENYFEIYRNIVLFFEIEKNLYKIKLSLRFSDRLNKLADELKIPIANLEKIKKELHDEILSFIETFFEKVVFSDQDNFCDGYIKSAFEISVYNNATDVDTILFLHYYQKARKEKKLKLFKIKWTEYNELPLVYENCNYEIFGDKLIYSTFFDNIEISTDLTMGFRSFVIECERDIEYQHTAFRSLMENVITVYDKYVEEELLKDAKRVYEEQRSFL